MKNRVFGDHANQLTLFRVGSRAKVMNEDALLFISNYVYLALQELGMRFNGRAT